MTNPEYARGYAAGRRRTEAELAKSRTECEAKEAAVSGFRAQAYCAALTGLLASQKSWSTGDAPLKTVGDYCDLARKFANHSVTVLK